MTVLVVSPHLDDAVLSFGGGIALHHDVTVATMLAGVPPAWSWPTAFDAQSGFDASDRAVRKRRLEDIAACDAISAGHLHLDFYDGQYGLDRDVDHMVRVLDGLFRAYDDVAVPLGMVHTDHELVARVCQAAMARHPRRVFLVYADLPAAKLWPEQVWGAWCRWRRQHFALTPWTWPTDLDAKRRARDHYESQLAFPELAWDNVTEERGWLAKYEG